MTCREKLAIEHPDFVGNEYVGGCMNCPDTYGYLEPPYSDCPKPAGETACRWCWDREIPEKCDCYVEDTERCLGTKEVDPCTCDGDTNKCDFYPEKRIAKDITRVGENASMNAKDFETCVKMVGMLGGHPDPVGEPGEPGVPVILDSGNRREFETGAVRDIQEGKGRCDLLPLDIVRDCYEYDFGKNDVCSVVFRNITDFLDTGDVVHLHAVLSSILANEDESPELNMFDGYSDMFLKVSKHFEEGAKKYGENNWQKGIPVHCYIDSAVRHYLKFLRGDKDEPHDRAFVWNIICAIWTCKHKPELNEYRKNQKTDEFRAILKRAEENKE
jgi:hypothetical protein